MERRASAKAARQRLGIVEVVGMRLDDADGVTASRWMARQRARTAATFDQRVCDKSAGVAERAGYHVKIVRHNPHNIRA
jgi:hypothetical protein